MELRQLSYFLAAAQTQSFRKAAELCLVAQPALSRQIAALEAELGNPLFERSKQGVKLTPAGQVFVGYASSALEQLQHGRQAMVNMQEGLEGTISVGCVEPLATAFLSVLFRHFHQHFPCLRLSVRVLRTDDVLSMVEQGEVDLGFIFDPDMRPEILVIKELFQQSLYLLVSSQHHLAQRTEQGPLLLEEVCNEPIVLLRETSRLRRRIEQIMARRGIRLQPTVEIDSIEGLKELVKQGAGITFLPPALLGSGQARSEVSLLPLLDMSEQFSFALVYRAFGTTSRPAMQFINHVIKSTENSALWKS
ncbi:MAG TPA: LysR family transcriptional regulator [Ktedonobacteraceae bacterium]